MSKLTKLTIKKFRNVVPTTLEFRPGINVVLGKNAAGKTTLLRLLSTAMEVPEEALTDEELEVSYSAPEPSQSFEHTVVRTRADEPELSQDPALFLPKMREVNQFRQTDYFVFKKTDGEVLRGEVSPSQVIVEMGGQRYPIARDDRARPLVSLMVALFTHPELRNLARDFHVYFMGSAGRLDESLERLKMLLGLRLEGDGRLGYGWNVSTIPRSMMMIPAKIPPSGTSMAFSLAFLNRVARVLGYDAANGRFDIERLNTEPGRQIVRLSNLRLFFKRSGEEISHDLLSYGQKRLLSFFAHADASAEVIIADELVNGLHHEWITACLEEIGDRQAFLTSQNPLLLDFLRFESAEEVRRTFILCERENRESGAQLIWRNPTEEEAESFFSAYQTGIQRVSDILLTKGLW